MKLPAQARPKLSGESGASAVGGSVSQRLSGLQRRFLAIVLAGAVGFAVIAGAIAYVTAHARAVDVGRQEVRALLDAVGKTAAIGAYADDKVLIQEILLGIAGNPLIARVEVASTSGELLGSAGAADPVTRYSMAVEHLLVSPFDADEPVGVLRAAVERNRLETDARSLASLLAGVMVGQTALVAMLLYLAAAILVSRPIVRLAAALRQMKPGSFEPLPTPPRHGNDEIGTLIASANGLLAANAEALARERDLRTAIERMEAQYREIFDTSSAGIFVLDGDGRLINGNPTVTRIIGRSVDEVRGLRRGEFIDDVFVQPRLVRELIEQAASQHETVSADLEVRFADQQSRWVHCLISVQGERSPKRLIEGVMYDVTERKRQEAEVRHRAEHDALTGLMNRASVDVAMDRLLESANRDGAAVSILCLDLDGFKGVNDRYGHKAGDRVLMEVAQRLRRATSSARDLVSRIGGDEFVLALPDIGPDAPLLSAVASRIIVDLQKPIAIDDDHEVLVGTSIGIACFPRHGADRRHLVHAADAVMYEVKRTGKNGFAMAFGAGTAD